MVHLAELNISHWRVSPLSQQAKDFIDNVERINTLAERSEGFVWRKKDEERDFRGRNILGGIMDLFTLSVWETPEHLEHFVWNTVHKQIYNRKQEWFSHLDHHSLVMWWVDEGHEPSLNEAKERLDHLNKNGDSDHAFGWSHLPHVKLWQSQQCG